MKLTHNFNCIHKVADSICEELKKNDIDCDNKAGKILDKLEGTLLNIKIPKLPSVCNDKDQKLDLNEIKIKFARVKCSSWNKSETITINTGSRAAIRELLEHELYHAYDIKAPNDILTDKAVKVYFKLRGEKRNKDFLKEIENKDDNYIQTIYMIYLSDLGEIGAKLQGYSYKFRKFQKSKIEEEVKYFKEGIRRVFMFKMKGFTINYNSWTDEQKKQFKEKINNPIEDIQKRINNAGKEYEQGFKELEKLVGM